MTSKDVYVIVNDEQQFRLYVVEQFGKIESRMDRLESRLGAIEAEQKAMRSEIVSLAHQQEMLTQKVDMGIWFTGICFGVLALIIAFVGIFAPKFWERVTHKESPSTPASAPAPTVINIPQPQIDIAAIARQLGELYHLEPKR